MRLIAITTIIASIFASDTVAAANWRDPSNRAVLPSKTVQATFQSGLLCELKDLTTNEVSLSFDPATLPSNLALFGKKHLDLDPCAVTTTSADGNASSEFKSPEGTIWQIKWEIDAATGDLILNTSAQTP